MCPSHRRFRRVFRGLADATTSLLAVCSENARGPGRGHLLTHDNAGWRQGLDEDCLVTMDGHHLVDFWALLRSQFGKGELGHAPEVHNAEQRPSIRAETKIATTKTADLQRRNIATTRYSRELFSAQDQDECDRQRYFPEVDFHRPAVAIEAAAGGVTSCRAM
jgi:hypothetical protein